MTITRLKNIIQRRTAPLPFANIEEVQGTPVEGYAASPRPWRIVAGPVGHAAILDRDGQTVAHRLRIADAAMIVEWSKLDVDGL